VALTKSQNEVWKYAVIEEYQWKALEKSERLLTLPYLSVCVCPFFFFFFLIIKKLIIKATVLSIIINNRKSITSR
jgi:hypothetical protein